MPKISFIRLKSINDMIGKKMVLGGFRRCRKCCLLDFQANKRYFRAENVLEGEYLKMPKISFIMISSQ